MAVYDLYGISTGTIESARQIVERLIPVKFCESHSDYKNGKYLFYGDEDAESFTIKSNTDPYDGEPAEPQFGDYPFLLYVDETERSSDLQKALLSEGESVALLRHEIL